MNEEKVMKAYKMCDIKKAHIVRSKSDNKKYLIVVKTTDFWSLPCECKDSKLKDFEGEMSENVALVKLAELYKFCSLELKGNILMDIARAKKAIAKAERLKERKDLEIIAGGQKAYATSAYENACNRYTTLCDKYGKDYID